MIDPSRQRCLDVAAKLRDRIPLTAEEKLWLAGALLAMSFGEDGNKALGIKDEPHEPSDGNESLSDWLEHRSDALGGH